MYRFQNLIKVYNNTSSSRKSKKYKYCRLQTTNLSFFSKEISILSFIKQEVNSLLLKILSSNFIKKIIRFISFMYVGHCQIIFIINYYKTNNLSFECVFFPYPWVHLFLLTVAYFHDFYLKRFIFIVKMRIT